ncbi:MAG: hypothetical protein WKH47_00875 [Actinomycetes bacterium]
MADEARSADAAGDRLKDTVPDDDDTWPDRFTELVLDLTAVVDEITELARDPGFHQHRRAISARHLAALRKAAARLYTLRLDLRTRGSS